MKHAERHHNLRREGSDEETFRTILDHIAYQPVIQCWKDNNVSFRKSNYASELVRIKEVLGQYAHDNPSVKDMQVRSQGCSCLCCMALRHFVQASSCLISNLLLCVVPLHPTQFP